MNEKISSQSIFQLQQERWWGEEGEGEREEVGGEKGEGEEDDKEQRWKFNIQR